MSGSQVLILSGLEAVQNQIWFHPTRGSFHFIPQGACEKTVFQSLIFFCKGGFVWWVGPTEKEELQHLIPSLTRAVQKKRFSDRDYVIFAVLGLTPAIPAKRVHSFHKGSFHKNRNQQREVANFHFSHNAVLEGGLVVLWELEPAALRGSMSPTNSASRFDRRGKRGKIYSKYPRLIE
jgi:hypothetical protein